MPCFPKTYKGRLFHREVDLGDKTVYERILINCPTKRVQETIREGLERGITKISPEMSRVELEYWAGQTSEFLHKELAFNFFDSAKEYYANGEQKAAFDEAYFFSDPKAKPHTLAELCEDDLLNCIGQNLAIKEVLHSTKWGLYALFNQHGASGHHILASIQGDYCVRIDPSTGPVRKQKEKVNDIYSFSKHDFFRRYQHSLHINQQH